METWTETDCTFEHEGRKFSAGGSHVDPVYLIAYPARDPQENIAAWRHDASGPLHDWHGNVIGTWRATRSWPVRSWIGSRMYQIYATVDRRTYTGRGFGVGMILRARRIASEMRAEGIVRVQK